MTRVRLADVAQESGYTPALVSRVLNDKTNLASEKAKARIREAAKRLGYVPDHFARSLRSQRSMVIGVAARLSYSPVMAAQFPALKAECEKAGYLVFFADIRKNVPASQEIVDNVPSALEALVRVRVDGIILWDDRDEAIQFDVPPLSVPAVAIASSPIRNMPTVFIDRVESSLRATNHLIERGHRNIIFLATKPGFNVGKIKGYKLAMEQAGLGARAQVVSVPDSWWMIPAFVRANLHILRSATAVVTQGMRFALEIYHGLVEAGLKVPEDISLINLSNRLSFRPEPPITTLEQPHEETARFAVKMLLDRMAGKPVRNKRLIPELIIQNSVSVPRASG